ncbi:hypothetical protein FNF27_05233 [Cafeteria roenbergensis]|uniref:Large ribosomal subunit protein uL23m n=2 Tax=Cafeteria roenbergensis TaxID=33653 RepID=A0A5A8CG44_CAFRO|nr:hypothetical protein FNF29_04138 [Cafeteria roenbergensis]KAA0166304.1 hypothetical protein FNF31_01528 [Cafeteria roenbergensis]KAA0168182.1 hypothetical protein FNF28_02600 [Cafeteria roenbergensis]KAA0173309.1 hypothetical protein FNF27_05233 [Cafeteria roenbergensis]|eukprot:KAA0152023.1 hypothetical protein FNF29_04138 [Cafeteria roenbergensis]
MPLPHQVWLPEIQLTLIRRATARMPRNNYVFRTAPKWTKPEIKQFLQKAYGVKVARVATINYPPRYSIVGRILRKRRAFKKVYVTVTDDALAAPARPDYDSEALSAMERA